MCGIAGLCRYKGNAMKTVQDMCLHMKRRGPDAEGYFSYPDAAEFAAKVITESAEAAAVTPEIVFGHRRLSIVDLTPTGAQPYVSASGRSVITYNGEIYNAGEIRKKLLSDKAVAAFRGTSDTEVLIEAIEFYGAKKTLQMAKGMFAFCVLNKETKTLTLARDRVGEKPLYFGWFENEDAVDQAFMFCSDIGSFTEIPEFRQQKKIRKDVLDLYFRYGYIPAPYTIYENVYKLEPGSVLTLAAPYAPFEVPAVLLKPVTGEGFDYDLYWSMRETALHGQTHLFRGSRQEAAQILENKLKDAIKGQMMADVPLGAFLSAGIDSSTIVSLMQSISPNKVRTFTIGMDDPKYNEAPIAGQIAEILGTEHTQMYISEQDAKDVIPKLADMFGEPFADSSQIPTYLVSKLTRQHVTVSLSGDAGDELFCGYRSYPSLERIWGKMKGVPLPIRQAAGSVITHSPLAGKEIWRNKGALLQAEGPLHLGRIQNIVEADAGQISLFPSSLAAREEFIPEDFYGDAGEINHLAMLRDLTMYHPDDILVKVDRTAMAVSLETRVPFLDRDVVEFAWTLPVDYLRQTTAQGTTGKLILRDILYQYVPEELMNRPKKGFSVPVRRWLKDSELRDWAEALIEPSRLKQEGLLDPDQVQKLWRDLTEKDIYRPQIWYILMFQQWLENQMTQ